MTPRELEKLLGGYATDTLTGEERRALFAAALEDQALFDALAREQALRDFLAEPAVRARLLAALDEPRPSFATRLAAWLRRPRVVALSATAAAALVAVAVFVPRKSAPAPEQPVLMAEMKQPEPPPPTPSLEVPSRDQRKQPKPAPRTFTPPPGGVVGGIIGSAPAAAALPPPPPVPPRADAAQDSALPSRRVFSRPPGGIIGVVGGVPPLAEERLEMAPTQPARMSLRQAEARVAPAAKENAAVHNVASVAPPPLRYITEGPLHAGRPIRLEFESLEPGWLYVFTADPEGWRLAASGKIDPGQPTSISLQFDEPGRKELLAIVSRTGQAALRNGEIAVPPAAAASRRIALDVTRP